MGIDDVDRLFRKPAPIRLECEHCGDTEGNVRRREHWFYTDTEAVLCVTCWSRWTPPLE
jgi:hypothetical protein